ncbi:MAG: ParA family protein [Oscillospiraceae bacterium]
MGKIIAITNQKGGVGKTTSTINLAAAMGSNDKKVLIVDADPQGNSTSGVNVNKKNLKYSLYDVLIDDIDIKDAIIKTDYKNLDIVPSNIDLAACEIILSSTNKREKKLKNALLTIYRNYDFILIDCPPSLGIITINGLTACDTVLVPIQCEYYALEGLSQLMSTIRQIKKMYNTYIEIEGVLLTMYDSRLNLTIQVVEEVKKFFPEKIFKTPIPRTVRIAEAPSFGMPIGYYDASSKGAKSYESVALEIIKNNEV